VGKGAKRRAHHLAIDCEEHVGTLRFVVLSQKVSRFGLENQLFEKIQDWRARC